MECATIVLFLPCLSNLGPTDRWGSIGLHPILSARMNSTTTLLRVGVHAGDGAWSFICSGLRLFRARVTAHPMIKGFVTSLEALARLSIAARNVTAER